ncbi:MAG: hypothetical protein ACKO6F_06110, partial [Cyanobium sp.]
MGGSRRRAAGAGGRGGRRRWETGSPAVLWTVTVKVLSVLGSTGSIGTQTLEIVEEF